MRVVGAEMGLVGTDETANGCNRGESKYGLGSIPKWDLCGRFRQRGLSEDPYGDLHTHAGYGGSDGGGVGWIVGTSRGVGKPGGGYLCR